ncbi:MAG: isoleucine--tRNA ligase [Bdellovibrionota bacterium]|jgi:isoleucyl-tRNA synthetase
MKFKKVESQPSFPDLEETVLKRWKEEKTFEASLERNKGKEEFVFYDGPPFPTGNPHHGTLFVSILKDLIPRYKTMRGYYVPRAWGWDCHGLPIETQAEKNLGITDKKEIETKIGIKAFNDECRNIVSKYNKAWETYIERIGRWVDFHHPYATLNRTFMESVIWAFSEAYKKGLIYKDFRVSPYCYRCQTPLSISDTRLDDSMRPRQDRTITVKFKAKELENTYFVAWTTTPWTLPSNLALAVGADVKYSLIKVGDEQLIMGSDCIAKYKKELDGFEVVEEFSGKELVDRGYTYQPLFPYYDEAGTGRFRVLLGDFVTTTDGTGIVHIAPYGEDDYWVCRANDIPLVAAVDEQGNLAPAVTDFAGKNVFEANPEIIRFLKDKGLVIRDETMEHTYPHCWRCRSPLIYKPLDAWYLNVTAIKDKLLKNNEEINWYPASVKYGRFGKWLENARDWNISRNRYWATPIPVWECDHCQERDVYGSIAELEKIAGHDLPDIHKEWLDPITYPCKCGGTKRHVPEVLDGWFESGSMPYGQWHYPFENKEFFKDHFPSQFVVEYSSQLRGWFYVMHVLSTALFDKPAFHNCLVHGTLLAADGKKLSKSLNNYTDPLVLLDKYGADAFRSYLLSTSVIWMGEHCFKDDGLSNMIKRLSLPLWNALSFFTTYAEIDQIDSENLTKPLEEYQLSELDRFILSETEILIDRITEKLDGYAIHEAMNLIPDFLDVLNNWYIRRSRQRMWSPDPQDPDKIAFCATIYRVLSRLTLVLAPFCPFLAENVWQRLGFTESVHLQDWPEVDSSWIDLDLSKDIETVRNIIAAGLAIRAREKIRVRQPLNKVEIVLERPLSLEKHAQSIQEELNVKAVEIVADVEQIAKCVGAPNARILGPKLGRDVQKVIALAKQGEFTKNSDGTFTVGDYQLAADEMDVVYIGHEDLAVESIKGVVVALDTTITPDLEAEGKARDLVRQIQEMRKEGDFNVTDRIEMSIQGLADVLAKHGDYIKSETLCVNLAESLTDPQITKELDIEGSAVTIAIKVVNN